MIRFPKEDLIGLFVMHDTRVFGEIVDVGRRNEVIRVFVKWKPPDEGSPVETWVPIDEVSRVTLDRLEWSGR